MSSILCCRWSSKPPHGMRHRCERMALWLDLGATGNCFKIPPHSCILLASQWLLPPRSGRMVIPGEIVCLYKEKSLAMWFPVYFHQSPRFQQCSPRQQRQPPRTQMPLVFPSKREGILPATSAKPKSQNHGLITPSRACGKGSFPFGCFSAGVVYTFQ